MWTGFDYMGEPTPYNKDTTNLLNFSDPAEREQMKQELEELGGRNSLADYRVESLLSY